MKIPKPIKYGLGEILLIVTGVLIAFSINNWNESRKLDDFEKKILKEIVTSLDGGNKNHIKSRRRRLQIIENSAIIIKNALYEKQAFHDSLNAHFNRIGWVLVFEPRTTAYESLRAKGINIIKNDSIRIQLLEFYGYQLPRTTWFVENFNNLSKQFINNAQMNKFIFLEDTSSFGNLVTPINYPALQEDQLYKNLILERKADAYEMQKRLFWLEQDLEQLSAQIHRYLKS